MTQSETRRAPGIIRRIIGHWGMLAAIVVGISVAGAVHVMRCHDEQAALTELRKADDGRQYVLSYSNPLKACDRLMDESVFSSGPIWLTDVLGVDPLKTAGAIRCIAPGNSFSYSKTKDGRLLIDASYNTGLEDQEMELITRLSNLRSLALAANPVSDSGVNQIGCLSELENLDLSNTRITDEALVVISTLPRLQTLTISHTHVTDDGLGLLVGTRTLEVVDVSMTRVTTEGVLEFEKQLPTCLVVNR